MSAKKSIEFFERAIRLDPGYAPAYAELASSYHFLGYNWPLCSAVAETRRGRWPDVFVVGARRA